MRDLSLHILDLIENSIRAGAKAVWISIAEEPASNRVEVLIEDDGPGLSVPVEVALDPFYTTKSGKRTGLGLPLFRGAAHRAGGEMQLSRSEHGGLRVHATFERDNVDRAPLGDLGATIAMVACTHPDLDVACDLRVGDRQFRVSTSELKRVLAESERDELTIARRLSETIAAGLQDVGVSL